MHLIHVRWRQYSMCAVESARTKSKFRNLNKILWQLNLACGAFTFQQPFSNLKQFIWSQQCVWNMSRLHFIGHIMTSPHSLLAYYFKSHAIYFCVFLNVHVVPFHFSHCIQYLNRSVYHCQLIRSKYSVCCGHSVTHPFFFFFVPILVY